MSNGLFDYVNSIQRDKKNLMRDSANDTLSERDYTPLMVNRALSQHIDTVLAANEMNCHYNLEKRPQYEFLLNIVRSRKRTKVKWHKPEKDEVMDAICAVYECNRRHAKQYYELMTKEQRLIVLQETETGGKK